MTHRDATDPALTFRTLVPADLDALLELSCDVWWMKARPADLVAAMLDNPALHVHGLFDDGQLVATGALLTDGLTKAVLVDVAVRADRRGHGLGDELMHHLMVTLPPHIEGILYCRTELTGFYEGHGFNVDPSYSLMLRR